MTKNEWHAVCTELEEYASNDNTEFGETCLTLLQADSNKCLISDNFKDALESEIVNSLNWYKDNCKLVTTEETRTILVTRLECRY